LGALFTSSGGTLLRGDIEGPSGKFLIYLLTTR